MPVQIASLFLKKSSFLRFCHTVRSFSQHISIFENLPKASLRSSPAVPERRLSVFFPVLACFLL
ncbi:MAG: hypothetical protein DBY37_13760 [Desulfovibrionaceae bacterium]|nr:MAG: hypothetical protein DBY37_13760 [Desulfovibrionaceae bacterium]